MDGKQAITDSPEIFEAQGFYEPEDGLPFGTSCLQYKFSIDGMAEIMGTQVKLTSSSLQFSSKGLLPPTEEPAEPIYI